MSDNNLAVDKALSELGRFGRWQVIKYVLVCLSVTVSGCWHMMVIVFTGREPDHHCRVPESLPLNATIPLETNNGKTELSSCNKYVNVTVGNWTVPCGREGWYYDPEVGSTIVTEWDLVCDRNYLSETSQSVFNFGVMVGALVCTTVADKIGRKPVHLFCQWSMVVVGVAIAYAPSFISFTVLRFILGIVREGAGLSGIVMACELFPAAQRTFAGVALELFWAGAWMLLAPIAYFIRDWRHLQLAVSIPPIVTVALYWYLPESIPWLAANNRVDEAENLLAQAAKFNKVSITPNILGRKSERKEADKLMNNDGHVTSKPSPDKGKSLLGKLKCCGSRQNEPKIYLEGPKEEKYGCVDFVKSSIMMKNCVIMCFLWFSSSLIYYGLSLSTSLLGGNAYFTFFLSGAVEVPAIICTIFVLQKYGRRWPLLVVHIFCGVVLIATVFIPKTTENGTDLIPLIITLAMLGKCASTFSFGTAVLYAPEIYPTNVRNIGFGLASCWGRIGGMLAPFSSYVGKIYSWVPGLVFAVISVFTGVSVLLLPETLNRPLPQTIADVEAWSKRPTTTQNGSVCQVRAVNNQTEAATEEHV